MSKTAATEAPARVRGRLADDIGRRLVDKIILGHFAPAARLDEVMLAERFRVSRTPVREALKQLAVTGLIDYRPNRGAVVAQLGDAQLDAMFEAIGEMEAACATPRRAAHDRPRTGRAAPPARPRPRGDADPQPGPLRRAEPRAALADLARRAQPGAGGPRSLVEAILAHDAVAAHREMRNHLLSARGATGRQTAWAADTAAATPSSAPLPSTVSINQAPT